MGFLLNPFILGSPSGAPRLSAATGALPRVGGAAAMKRAMRLSGDPGHLTLAGGAATLSVASEPGYHLVANAGALALVGGAAAFKRARRLAAASGALTLAGGAATLAQSGSSPDPHRYWMIFITANNGNLLAGLAELELYETAGGSNVATGGTASANSWLADGFQASYAFDGIQSGSNGWASYVAGAPWWIKYDFGAGNEKDINEIGMWAKNVGLDEMPKDFDIRWSDDDSTWTTKWSVTNATSWAEYERRRFTNP